MAEKNKKKQKKIKRKKKLLIRSRQRTNKDKSKSKNRGKNKSEGRGKKNKKNRKKKYLIKRGRPTKRGRHVKRITRKSEKRGKTFRSKKYSPKTLRGMRDILPDEGIHWNYFIKKAIELAEAYGFKRIRTPVLEERILFEKSTGTTSDVVGKQMYEFTDRGGKRIVMRPEFTPSIVRAYIEHGMFNLPQPVKLFYLGPLFRYERPQSGRLREFWQFGLEVLGSEKPVVDAQIILFSQALFTSLGINASIQINSLGCSDCRKAYRGKLISYFKSKKKWLCQDCQRRLTQNPLRILDCNQPACRDLILGAPQLIDDLCEDCRDHFVKVLEYLDEAGVVYELNPYLVRGLDYYTRTVFEFWPSGPIESKSGKKKEKGEKQPADLVRRISGRSALGGGGRYDNLVEQLSGRPSPAVGLSYGLERIIEEIKLRKIKVFRARAPRIFLAQLGEAASRCALRLFEDLRKKGFKLVENFAKGSLRTQLEIANKLGVKLTLIIGQQEVHDKTIIVRDMNSGNQEVVDQEKIVKELKRRLR